LKELIAAKTGALIALDAAGLARQAGNIMSVNIVLLGALCHTGILPVTASMVREAIKTRTKEAFVETNLKAFELGYGAAAS
jgi:indolepyruvate ferredoxin oxidoreductase beta subunit